ncbi:MAG: hypothetical protein E6J26_02390, partial [Chloroflexi bacterium]
MNAYARHSGDALVLGNAMLERRLNARPGEPCLTTAFVNRLTGRDYLRPDSAEFSFDLDGHLLTGADFRYTHADLGEGDPAHASVYLANPHLDLELHIEVYSAHPVIRKHLRLTNRSDQPLVLSNLHWEDLNLLVDSPSNCEVWHDYFSRRAKAVSVSMDDCVLLVNDTRLHEGFILASEAPGPLKRLEAYACGSRVAAGLNRDEETVFERVLAPGESFSTPACFLLTFANPIPQDVIDGDYARFVGERLTVCDVKRVPSISINTWEPFYTNINRDLLLQQIDLAADLGVDAYQVDDGWFDYMGDWNDDLAKFPHGLGEIAQRCRARGMKFGLWMAVAIVDEHSRVAREHPECVAR